MFDKNFYPTPKNVISKMLGYDRYFSGKRILEPSAGKGDILDYISKNKLSSSWNNNSKDKMYCIEKNPDLQNILRGKEYKVIAEDFILYEPDYIFDYIIMNPPFDAGAKHLLKAWEISKGAEIICLLNAETYYNDYTKERQLLKSIIDEYGQVEDFGNCFRDAERKTDVEIICVTLKNRDYEKEFDFTGDKQQEEYIVDKKEYNLANLDEFRNLVDSFNRVKEISKEIIKLTSEMDYYGDFFRQRVSMSKELAECTEGNKTETYNKFIEIINKTAWDHVINNTKIHNKVTRKVKDDFQDSQQKQGQMAFTYDNIAKFWEELIFNQGSIMQKCVEDAFDLITKYHKENRVYVEGWKTNDRWKVNKKFILPRMRNDWRDNWELQHTGKEILADIEKAMCFITRKDYAKINGVEKTIGSINKYNNETRSWEDVISTNKWYDSEFFEFKVFKKGTMHFKFKDKWLYEKFNETACKMKNWLGVD